MHYFYYYIVKKANGYSVHMHSINNNIKYIYLLVEGLKLHRYSIIYYSAKFVSDNVLLSSSNYTKETKELKKCHELRLKQN